MTAAKPPVNVAPHVLHALSNHKAVVALESTVITHGLPYPENLQLAQDMEGEVIKYGVTPATIAVLDGQVRVGLNADQLQFLASQGGNLYKVSRRDFGPLIAAGESGGTTVAGTSFVADLVGIRVFATGGIGGVHYQVGERSVLDISADLPALAQTPIVVVCAGAKAILDIPATLEYLETWTVPVVGYRTDEFPAFYSLESGLKTSARANHPTEVHAIAQAHWALGNKSAVLVVVPPPEDVALPAPEMQKAVNQALRDAEETGVSGQKVTPFLLNRVSELTSGASLHANL
ncbi:MAG: pseudouridine-5'-phosphate glycosidase, partial [Anaerolineales bacterium]